MTIGISLPPNLTIKQQSKYVKKANSRGFDQIWVGDNPPNNNAFATISTLINQNQDIQFWTGVTSPFYYVDEVVISLLSYFGLNFPQGFGLGISTGNPIVTKNQDIMSKPFSNFRKRMDGLLPRIQGDEILKGIPIAIGGLGSKMGKYGFLKADYLSLNSGSLHDLNRVLSIKNSINSSTPIIPYTMLEILGKDQKTPSPYIWHMVKGISKTCSKQILTDHGYSNEMIRQLHSLSWDYDNKVPKGELRKLIYDFALVGKLEEIEGKLNQFFANYKQNLIAGIVFGWVYNESQWDDIEKIAYKFKQ